MISVIVPVYKVENYLRQCLDSLAAQTLEDMEIIIVDDGSPDGCPDICDEYAAKDARMKVVHKKNGGLLSARKAGFAASKGDYIGFVDGDDWVEPDTFLNLYKAVCDYSPDMVLSDFLCDYGDRAEPSSQCFEESFYGRERLEKEIFPRMLFDGRFYSFGVNPNCWSKLVRRELIEKNLLPVDERIRMGEDAAFIYPCMLDSQSIACVKTPTYHYRITEQSMSNAYDEKLRDIIFLPYRRLKEKNVDSDFDISNQLDYYLLYMVNFLLRNEAKKANTHSKKERRRVIENICADENIRSAAGNIDAGKLPAHTKLLASALKRGSVFMTEKYVELLKVYLR